MSSSALRIVLLGDIVTPNLPRLQRKADFDFDVRCVAHSASETERTQAIHWADAVVTTAFDKPAPQATSLKLVQGQGAGYERILFDCVPAQATICNSFGHVRAAAEYALMTMLMWTHRWKDVETSFRAGSWQYGSMSLPTRNELNSQTVGIVGLGHMGREIAQRVQAMGVRVLGCARTQPEDCAAIERFWPLQQLDAFLAECDFVILSIALTPQTQNLIDEARLRHMRRNAVLINLARGPVVHEQALYEALTQGTIGGAVLDVWWQYPDAANPNRRGSTLPFHDLPNVLMTPHSSQWTEQMMDRRWDMIVANLGRLKRGEPLRDIVRPPRPV